MAGSSSVSGSPCGACKFLRRKCIRGCVFAPYFSHEQGATHFAAIHKVFGASNVSKLLAHLPVSDRCEAAVTISYEAQARLQDPIYGCVSHIFSLQQQVVNLQTQLAYLKEQASQTCVNNASTNENPNEKSTTLTPPQDLQSLFHVENSNNHQLGQEFHTNNLSNISSTTQYYVNNNNHMDLNPMRNYENSRGVMEENSSFSSFEESTSNSMSYDMQTNRRTWGFDEVEDLHSVAFGYS
ncbi:LOB domain-containing protein 29 [Trifolium repens]|nr:LOB domain-containing protein 29 [Trifolium repens]